MSESPNAPAAARCVPRAIAWEVTRACPLACPHCRASAGPGRAERELATDECLRLLESIASFAKPIVILTGGEPMARPDIFEIAAFGSGLGLRMAMAPCGLLLDDGTAARAREAGIGVLSLSLDGATEATHDAFRGYPGLFRRTLAGIEAAKRAGIAFQINTTVCKTNVDELPSLLGLAVELGARTFNPFLLVPTGRGKRLAHLEIEPARCERVLTWLAGQAGRKDIEIRVTCAPHYQRILRQAGAGGSSPRSAGGCLGGKSFAFISHTGTLQICGFLDVECGDARRAGFDFARLWNGSAVFQRVRNADAYGGRCGVCEYRRACGGCRARAYAFSGDYMGEEPFCVHQPRRRVAPKGRAAGGGAWDTLDKKLLSLLQAGLPVQERPYAALAAEADTDPHEALARLRRLRAEGAIRRIGPIFDSARLGYASTLVAAKVPLARLDGVVEEVNRLPGVTHNYRREHVFNLWFTLTAQSPEALRATLENLRRSTGIPDIHSLPSQAIYKLQTHFALDGGQVPPVRRWRARPAVRLTEAQKEMVRLVQDDIEVTARPFDMVAERLGWRVGRVVDQLREWLAEGVVRRFGGVVNHRRLGFAGNGMAVFRAPPGECDRIGNAFAENPQVSHCYRRIPIPGWDYNLFAMVHGFTESEVARCVERMAAEAELADYDVLFSAAEYKKTSMRYFVENDGG